MAGPVDELVDDFLALRRDGRVPAWRSLEADHGALEFCGDEVHMTLTFVGSDGLTLLTAGTIEQTVTRPRAIDLEAEARKLEQLKAERAELLRLAQPVIAQCKAEYPE